MTNCTAVSEVVERLRVDAAFAKDEPRPDGADMGEAADLLTQQAARIAGLEADAERWLWLEQHLSVASDEPESWTCWLHLDEILYRSKTESVRELLDELIKRFPRDAACRSPIERNKERRT